jgi:hypothetical protein
MLRFIFASLTALCLSAVVFAQAAPSALSADVSPQPASRDGASGEPAWNPDIPARPFPLMSILETILTGEISWRPDWPVEMPPDLFAVPDAVRSVTVSLEFPAAVGTEPSGAGVSEADDSLEPANSTVYTLSRDETGRLTDFPFFMNGGFFQTAVNYDELGRISGALVSAPTVWQIEFMEHDDKTGQPSLARLNAGNAVTDAGPGGVWFFAVLEYGGASVSETWYDPAGTGLAVYNYRYAPLGGKKRLVGYAAVLPDGESHAGDCYYDSWGNLTGIGGVYSAVYRDSRPLYWRRPLPSSNENAVAPDAAGADAAGVNGGEGASPEEIPWRFIFQWDEKGLVTRLRAYPEDVDAGDGWDARYDYLPPGGENDGGGWEERRETRMIRLGDYFFPRPGVLARRQITYREQ